MATVASTRTRRLWIAGGVLLLLLVIAFSVPWKLNFVRGMIAERVEAATGRAFAIEGDVTWSWWKRRLVAERMRFANPAWAGHDQMITVDKVDAHIRLLPLFSRRVVIPEVRAVKPDLWLETNAQGQFNGNLDREQSDEKSGVELGEVWLDQGKIRFVQKHTESDVQLLLESTAGGNDGDPRLKTSAKGVWHGLPLAAQGSGDAVLRLRDVSRPYALDIAATIGATKVKAAGTVTGLSAPTAADLRVQGEGPSLGDWYRIANIGLPNTPPYRTEGRVRLENKTWHYEEFKSRVGDSDLSGRVHYQPRPTRPFISGTLVSQRLDLEDFSTVIGKAPPAGASAPPPKAGAPKPKARAPTGATDDKLMPQLSFSSEKWNTFDADIQFEGRSIRNLGKHPFERVKMHVVMNDRRLTIDPMQFGFAGGELEGKFNIDGSSEPMTARLDARGRRLKLDDLLPQMRNTRMALGSVNGKAALAGRGNSFAQLLATADGEAQMAMGKGQISNLLLEVIDLDAQEALGFLIRGDRPVDVRCALVDVGFKKGVMEARTIVFDTTDTIIEATGKADFAREQLDMRVKPVPKDMSLLTLRVPFDVRGSFKDPQITPDKAGLIARGGGALLLGSVAPIAALLALIETGPGKDSDCGALVARAQSEGVPVKNAPGASTPAPVKPAPDQNKKQ
jgi:uncharacterized protein involved in outer membrane biogenesis